MILPQLEKGRHGAEVEEASRIAREVLKRARQEGADIKLLLFMKDGQIILDTQ
jgi:hypothetical protein